MTRSGLYLIHHLTFTLFLPYLLLLVGVDRLFQGHWHTRPSGFWSLLVISQRIMRLATLLLLYFSCAVARSVRRQDFTSSDPSSANASKKPHGIEIRIQRNVSAVNRREGKRVSRRGDVSGSTGLGNDADLCVLASVSSPCPESIFFLPGFTLFLSD